MPARVYLSQRISQSGKELCLFSIDYGDNAPVAALLTFWKRDDVHGHYRVAELFQGNGAYSRASEEFDKQSKHVLADKPA
jgi:hypothetical protein